MDFQHIETAKRDKVPETLSDCYSGDKLYFDAILQLIRQCLCAVQGDRIETGAYRALVACSTITYDNLSCAEDNLLSEAESKGIRFCPYDKFVLELLLCFNWEFDLADDTDGERYEVWLEQLPKGQPANNAKMLGFALGGIRSRWRGWIASLTIGRRIDLLDPAAHGILAQGLTREEAFKIRKTLVENGALASAGPMKHK